MCKRQNLFDSVEDVSIKFKSEFKLFIWIERGERIIMYTNLNSLKKVLMASALLVLMLNLTFVSGQAGGGYGKWGPRVDYLQLINYNSYEGEALALQAGAIDVMDWPLDYDTYMAIKDDPDFVKENLTMYDIYDIDINNLRWPTSDYRFRKAIAYLIDYETFYTNVLRAYTGVLMDNIIWWEEAWTEWYNPSAQKYWYDPEVANDTLIAAGYKDWDSDGWLEYKNETNTYELPSLDFYVRNDDPLRLALGQMINSELNAFGIPTTKIEADADVCSEHVYTVPYDYHLYTAGMGPFRDVQFLYDYYHSQFADPNVEWVMNNVFFINATYDSYVETLKFASDEATAKEACQNAQEIFMDQVPLIPVYHSAGAEAYLAKYGHHAGEEAYWDMPWNGFVNGIVPTVQSGVNDWWTLLNAHPGDVERGGVLRFGMMSDVINANPVTIYWIWDFILIYELYSTLTMLDPYTGDMIPWLAKEWKMETWDNGGEPASKLTYTLYDSIKWSDGTPLTSYDVAFTMKYMYDTGSPSFYSYVEMIDGIDTDTPHIETPNATTVIIYYSVESIWAKRWAEETLIIPKHVWETILPEQVESQGEFVTTGNLTGCGPFVIDSYKTGEWWLLRRNPYFFRKLAADIDANAKVDIRDIAAVAKAFAKTVPLASPILDQNGDKKIDIRDIAFVAKNFGKVDP